MKQKDMKIGTEYAVASPRSWRRPEPQARRMTVEAVGLPRHVEPTRYYTRPSQVHDGVQVRREDGTRELVPAAHIQEPWADFELRTSDERAAEEKREAEAEAHFGALREKLDALVQPDLQPGGVAELGKKRPHISLSMENLVHLLELVVPGEPSEAHIDIFKSAASRLESAEGSDDRVRAGLTAVLESLR